MSDDWEIVREGIISDEMRTRPVERELAALQRLQDQHNDDQTRIEKLQQTGATAIEFLRLLSDFYASISEILRADGGGTNEAGR
jgi:hypothetical protein